MLGFKSLLPRQIRNARATTVLAFFLTPAMVCVFFKTKKNFDKQKRFSFLRTKNANKMLTELLTKNRSLFVEIRERILISGYVFSCDVGVNLPHGSAVRPTADFLCNLLWYLEVVSQRSEAVPESVDGDIR